MFAISQLSRSLEQAKIVGTAQRDMSKKNGGGGVGWGGVGWGGVVWGCCGFVSQSTIETSGTGYFNNRPPALPDP